MTYRDRLAALGCLICGQPAQIHHCRSGSMGIVGTGRKSSDALAIPLCMRHHTGRDGIHTIGVATWEATYGPQMERLKYVHLKVGPPPARPVRRPRARSKKMLDRRHA